ncbi:MAG: dihydroorotate dehydrogenase electron transfer subunit [Deltaproteobacteria bacterium]|nr:MAG: dihydroorotate dehydrogenase electron transfer subunit [Deltaproteobacteria bacterium]
MLLRNAEVLFNDPVSVGLYHMGLRCPEIAARIQPGQFLMVRVLETLDPLLRRPFAVHRVYSNDPPTSFEILYRVVGRGTRILAEVLPRTSLSLLGPLGSGFRPPDQDGFMLMIAGGIGIAPLPFLAETLVESGLRGPYVLWFGGKSAGDLVCVEHFQNLGFAVELATEDGSAGRKGLVTQHLEKWMSRQAERPTMVYSCGPHPMQRQVAELVRQLGVKSQLSMEALMACGVGTCLSCSLRCRPPDRGQDLYYANVCQEGPVLLGEDIVWE